MTSFIANTSSTVRRVVLTEGAQLAIPDGAVILHSEVVQDSNDVEVLELWVAIPTISDVDAGAPTSEAGKTIYTNTVVYEDDDYSTFEADIEQAVSDNFSNYEEDWDEYDD